MLNRVLQNHWCRLLAGNLSIGLLVVGIPVCVLLTIQESLSVPTGGVLVLAIVHFALIGMQISRQGTWIPEKWLAAGFLFLPVLDAVFTVRWFSQRSWAEGIWALLMAVASAFVTVWIVKNQWRKWRSPKTATVTITRSKSGDQAVDFPADDPTTMVY